MVSNENNRVVDPEAKEALRQMKLETANELGINNYDNIDKGNLTSRQNGDVGGYLIEMAQKQMADQNGTTNISNSTNLGNMAKSVQSLNSSSTSVTSEELKKVKDKVQESSNNNAF